MSSGRSLSNYLLFQAGWTAAVLAVRAELWLLAPCAGLATAAWCVARSDRRPAELLVLGLATLLGTLVDSLGVALGVVDFPDDPSPRLLLVPLWITGQWLNFATTLRHSLAWLAPRPVLAALLGAVGGPLAYRSSAALGIVRLHPDAGFAYGALALEWALVTPLLLAIARRLGAPAAGVAERAAPRGR